MTAITRARRAAAAVALTAAAPLAAVVAAGSPAHADPSHCPITYHWKGHGNLSSTLWVDSNPCSRPSRIKIYCQGMGYSRTVRGKTVTKGATKATCNPVAVEGPAGAAYFEYKVGGKWWSRKVAKGKTTFYS
jgi:hypothetical protein